jgi:hypothetical protein
LFFLLCRFYARDCVRKNNGNRKQQEAFDRDEERSKKAAADGEGNELIALVKKF